MGAQRGARGARRGSTCRLLRPCELFASSEVAQNAFGAEVVAHYVNAADVELEAFGAAVTDWERVRGFKRL